VRGRAATSVALLAALAGASGASAYKVDRHVVPQPRLHYYVGLKDWKKPFGRVARVVNRAHVGVRLVRAKIPEQASIQIGRLDHQCGYPGVNGVTQTLRGGYAAIYLPYNCHGRVASIIAAHELGHALGLRHENRRCALMNSSAGPNGIPTHCRGRSGIDWLRHPFRGDDLAGLRKVYRNTAPIARIRVTSSAPYRAGRRLNFSVTAKDRERNVSEVVLQFGDGTPQLSSYSARRLPHSHVYSEPGTFVATLTVTDFYQRKSTSKVRVKVVEG
jgi:hypothetical protein